MKKLFLILSVACSHWVLLTLSRRKPLPLPKRLQSLPKPHSQATACTTS